MKKTAEVLISDKKNLTKLFEDISKFDAPKNQPVIAPSNKMDISCHS